MRRLQPLLDGISISTAFGKRYKESVLDPIFDRLKDVAGVESERVRHTEQYAAALGKLNGVAYYENEAAKLSERIDLLKQAVDLGIDISGYGVDYDSSINGLTEMLGLEEKVAQAKIGQLQQQGNLLKLAQQQAIEEQKRVNGLQQAMDQLKGAMTAVGAVSSAFAQRLKTQYLDPLIEKLQTAAGIDSERVRLVNE